MAQKQKIKSTIHFYKEGNLIDKFNNFIDKETSVTVEAEDRESPPPKSPEQLLFLAVVYQEMFLSIGRFKVSFILYIKSVLM